MAGETDRETDKGTTIIKSIFYIWSVTASRRTGRHWDARRTHKYGHTHTDSRTQAADDGHTKVDLDFELSKPKTN